MSSLEKPTQKTLESIPNPEEAREILGSLKDLGAKLSQVDTYLRSIEDKLEHDPTLRKDEKAELERLFNEISSHKAIITPHVESVSAPLEKNGYEQHLEDRASLAEMVGTHAQGLSQESLQKMFMQPTEEPSSNHEASSMPLATPIIETPSTTPTSQEPVVTISGSQATALEQAPSSAVPQPTPTTEGIPEAVPVSPAPEAVVSPQQKTPAQQLAEKIRNLESTGDQLTAEELAFRNNPEHWPAVEQALMELARPTTTPEGNFIEMGKPSLERITLDYADQLFKNKAVITRGFDAADPLVRASLKKLSEDYHAAHFAKLTELQQSGANLEDQMSFYKQQSEALAQEIMKRENKMTQERVGKAVSRISTGAGRAFLYTVVLGGELIKGAWNKGSELAQQGIKKITEFVTTPQQPKTLKERLLERIGVETKKTPATPDGSQPKKPSLVDKYGKTNQQKINQRIEMQKKMKALEEERALEKETTAVLEKIIGEKLEGDTLKKWERLGEITIVGFFNPTTKLHKKLEDYPEHARKIYEAIAPIYKRDLVSRLDTKLKDYIRQIVKNGDTQKIWNQPLPNNS